MFTNFVHSEFHDIFTILFIPLWGNYTSLRYLLRKELNIPISSRSTYLKGVPYDMFHQFISPLQPLRWKWGGRKGNCKHWSRTVLRMYPWSMTKIKDSVKCCRYSTDSKHFGGFATVDKSITQLNILVHMVLPRTHFSPWTMYSQYELLYIISSFDNKQFVEIKVVLRTSICHFSMFTKIMYHTWTCPLYRQL